VFVDHGLLRQGEGDQVMRTFADSLGVQVIRVDAEQQFMDALHGQGDPETKRKIIGGPVHPVVRAAGAPAARYAFSSRRGPSIRT